MIHKLPSAPAVNAWPVIPSDQRDSLPIVVSDLDGTLRGDVGPMVRMAGLLVPKFLHKMLLREPVRAGKTIRFLWGVICLWTLRTINREHRRRYKYLFSELHTLAASLLSGMDTARIRKMYRQNLVQMGELWYPEAIDLLRRLTQSSRVILITGSEQIQTEECVRLLADHGVDISRIHVHGSLYTINPETMQFTGGVTHLNVTLDGKRESLACYTDDNETPFVAAFGNSRPDRALFEAVGHDGLRVLICRSSVLKGQKRSSFVIRKLNRSGFPVVWSQEEYQATAGIKNPHLAKHKDRRGRTELLPVLTTDREFALLAANGSLAERYEFLTVQERRSPSAESVRPQSPVLPVTPRLPDPFPVSNAQNLSRMN
ncbi:MAG: haloacid dehalogenase-like hydrolase [Planctomycetota bacterium]|jgi:phosphoserine phosphatase